MAFERLQALGEEKFQKILNLLMRGHPAMTLAREIQQHPPAGWGLFQNVSEKTLTQQLNRLRLTAAEGMYGPRVAKRIAEGAKPQQALRILNQVSVQVLDRLEELSEMQRDRVLALAKTPPSTAVNGVFDDYRQLLLDIQKVRFEMGLDELKAPVSGAIRGVSQTMTFPDGMSVQKQVFEAVNTVEQIFEARRIPRITPQ